MVKGVRSRRFEDLDFNLVRDLWKVLLKGKYTCFSMEELVLKMKKLGYGKNKVVTTIRVLVMYRLIHRNSTRVYRSMLKGKFVRGKIMVYKHGIIHEDFIEKYLSLCNSEKYEKGGTGKGGYSTIPLT